MNPKPVITMKLFLILVCVAVGIVSVCAGCNLLNQHAQMMDAMRGTMKDASDRLGQSGTGMIQASGAVNNPGVRVSAGMEYFAVARYEGLSGQVSAAMSGKLDREVPDFVREEGQKIWRNTSWDREQRREKLWQFLNKSGAIDKLFDAIFGNPATSQPSN